ncbi:hypothetical protein M8C21_020421, partial [Ambrosia artemisiifolia]
VIVNGCGNGPGERRDNCVLISNVLEREVRLAIDVVKVEGAIGSKAKGCNRQGSGTTLCSKCMLTAGFTVMCLLVYSLDYYIYAGLLHICI